MPVPCNVKLEDPVAARLTERIWLSTMSTEKTSVMLSTFCTAVRCIRLLPATQLGTLLLIDESDSQVVLSLDVFPTRRLVE
jgi:hypothetical protein